MRWRRRDRATATTAGAGASDLAPNLKVVPSGYDTAFVFSGGGNLGSIQVGMLRALLGAGIVPDLLVGCSVGRR